MLVYENVMSFENEKRKFVDQTISDTIQIPLCESLGYVGRRFESKFGRKAKTFRY
jgi:hypothetical protein